MGVEVLRFGVLLSVDRGDRLVGWTSLRNGVFHVLHIQLEVGGFFLRHLIQPLLTHASLLLVLSQLATGDLLPSCGKRDSTGRFFTNTFSLSFYAATGVFFLLNRILKRTLNASQLVFLTDLSSFTTGFCGTSGISFLLSNFGLSVCDTSSGRLALLHQSCETSRQILSPACVTLADLTYDLICTRTLRRVSQVQTRKLAHRLLLRLAEWLLRANLPVRHRGVLNTCGVENRLLRDTHRLSRYIHTHTKLIWRYRHTLPDRWLRCRFNSSFSCR